MTMSCRHIHRAVSMAYLATLLTGWSVFAVDPYTDDFDSGYIEGGSLNGTSGWTGPSSVIVTSTPAFGGSGLAAYVPDQMAITNTTTVAGNLISTWIDMQVQVTKMNGDPSAPRSDMAAQFYFNENGYPVVLDGTTANWVTISNVMRNVNLEAVVPVSDGWNRVAVFMNYANETWALFVDDQMIDDDIAFHTASTSFSKLVVENETSIDDVAFRTAALTGSTATSDSDRDGMGDVFELTYWGLVTVATGTGDADGDGRSNAEEFTATSNPLVADNSSLQMPYREDFGSATLSAVYTNSTGWRGITNYGTMNVVSDAVDGDGKGLDVAGGNMSIQFTNTDGTNVWVQIYSKPAFYDDSSGGPAITNSEVAKFYVSTGGLLRAYSDTNYVTLAYGIPSNTWLGFAVHLDYSAKEWNVYVSKDGYFGTYMTRTNAANLLFNSEANNPHLTKFIVKSEGSTLVDVVAASYANNNLLTTHTNVIAYDRLVGDPPSDGAIPPYDFGSSNVAESNSVGGAAGDYLMWGMDVGDELRVPYTNAVVNVYTLESGSPNFWEPKDGDTMASTNVFLSTLTALSMKKLSGRDTVVFYPYGPIVTNSVTTTIYGTENVAGYGYTKLSLPDWASTRSVNGAGTSGLQFTNSVQGDRMYLPGRIMLQYNGSQWVRVGSWSAATDVVTPADSFFYYNKTANDYVWSPSN